MSLIRTQNLCVSFPVYTNASRSFKNAMLNATTGGTISSSHSDCVVVNAVDDLTLTIKEGERVGLVGHNGSGKTTLLRMLAGAYEPTAGTLEIKGRIASFLDIALGVDQEATGYDNILMRGILMGLSRKEIVRKTPEIAEFTGLGDYLNMPVRTYSSGMMMRLAFTVSTSVCADIVLMDEWLSVGDMEFQKRAQERLKTMVDQAAILVIASHQEETIQSVCNRVIKLKAGKVISDCVTAPQPPSILPAHISSPALAD